MSIVKWRDIAGPDPSALLYPDDMRGIIAWLQGLDNWKRIGSELEWGQKKIGLLPNHWQERTVLRLKGGRSGKRNANVSDI